MGLEPGTSVIATGKQATPATSSINTDNALLTPVDASAIEDVRANQARLFSPSLAESISEFVDRDNFAPLASTNGERAGLFSQAHGQLQFAASHNPEHELLRNRLNQIEKSLSESGTAANEVEAFAVRAAIAQYYNANPLRDSQGILPDASARTVLERAPEILGYCDKMLEKIDASDRKGILETWLSNAQTHLEKLSQTVSGSASSITPETELNVVKLYREIRDIYKAIVDPKLD